MQPLIFAIDVGSPKNLGWANSRGGSGTYETLEAALQEVGKELSDGGSAAIGFEAPTWVPRRPNLLEINKSRGGVEITGKSRPWSGGPGSSVTATALAVMPWALTTILEAIEPKPTSTTLATVIPEQWEQQGGLLVWEAFVSGDMKGDGHAEDAKIAVEAFLALQSDYESAIPPQAAFSTAAASLMVTGWRTDWGEVGMPCLVVAPGGNK